MDTGPDGPSPDHPDRTLMPTHAAFGLTGVQTFSQEPYTLAPPTEELSTAASPSFPFSYSPRRPSFLMTASPSSSPGYGHFKSAAAPVSRRRSGSIGFLSRTTTQLETSSSSSLDDPRNQDVHRPPLPAPPDAAKGFFPEASIRSFTNGFESEWSSMRSTSAPDPTAPGRPYPLASTAHVEGCDRMYLVQRHGEGRARSMSTLDNSEYNYLEERQRQEQFSPRSPQSPQRRRSMPESDVRSPSKPTLPPLSTLFPELQRNPVSLSTMMPHAPWHDDVLALGLFKIDAHRSLSIRDQPTPRGSTESSSDLSPDRQIPSRHLSAGHRFPEAAASRTALDQPHQARTMLQSKASNRSISDLSDLSESSAKSEPSPAPPYQTLCQDAATRFKARGTFVKDEPKGEASVRDTERKRYAFPPPRDLRQMFKTVKPATNFTAPSPKSGRPRAESMISPEPAQRPQIRRVLSWRASKPPSDHNGQPEVSVSTQTLLDSSSPLSGFDSEDSDQNPEEEPHRLTRKTRSSGSDGRLAVIMDHRHDQYSTEWDMISKHGRPLTRRSKIIINDTDRRRPGYVRPIEEDRKKVRTLLDALLRAAPGNGKHLKARFPYEPKTRRMQLDRMGLRMVWGSDAPFSESELASSTRRFRKEQCERLITTIEAGYIAFESIESTLGDGQSDLASEPPPGSFDPTATDKISRDMHSAPAINQHNRPTRSHEPDASTLDLNIAKRRRKH